MNLVQSDYFLFRAYLNMLNHVSNASDLIICTSHLKQYHKKDA